MVFSSGRGFSPTPSAAGQAGGGRRYTTKHVWIPAELRDGALSIQRRRPGPLCQGVVFRLAERSGCMKNPTLFWSV